MEAFLSQQELESIIERISKTSAGKDAIQKAMGGKRNAKFVPRFEVPSRDTAVDRVLMISKAEEMKEILFRHITADTQTDGRRGLANFPKNAIIVEPPVAVGGGSVDYIINISFDAEALRRQSLNPFTYPDGINDIISLFVHGYDARGAVVGTWHGEENVWSLQHRDPNDFMTRAVAEFNENNKQGGFVTAALREKYK